MKPVEFFKEKAENLLQQVGVIELHKVFVTEKDDLSHFFKNEATPQTKQLEEIKFQTKLMFTEFDNGQIFIDKMEKKDDYSFSFNDVGNWNKVLIDELKYILSLFKDYLAEYRE